MSVYSDLSRTCARIARSRPDWVNDPSFQRFVSRAGTGLNEVEAIVQSVRGYRIDPEGSDKAVLALAALAQNAPDALTVLLQALAPSLRVRLSRSVTEDYRVDALADLVFVVCDAIERRDLDQRPQLALRLVNRAHNRVYKRARRTSALAWAPEWICAVADEGTTCTYGDVAELAAARADLAGFGRAVDEAIERGQLSAAGWDTFRDHRLSRLVHQPSGSTSSQRALAARFARRLRPLLDIYLAGHAA